MTKFMECCAVKKQLPEASPSIHLTCHGSSQGKSSMRVVFNVQLGNVLGLVNKTTFLDLESQINNFWLFSGPF